MKTRECAYSSRTYVAQVSIDTSILVFTECLINHHNEENVTGSQDPRMTGIISMDSLEESDQFCIA